MPESTFICASAVKDPKMSIGRHSQLVGLSETTIWSILLKKLVLKVYKVQMTKELKLELN